MLLKRFKHRLKVGTVLPHSRDDASGSAIALSYRCLTAESLRATAFVLVDFGSKMIFHRASPPHASFPNAAYYRALIVAFLYSFMIGACRFTVASNCLRLSPRGYAFPSKRCHFQEAAFLRRSARSVSVPQSSARGMASVSSTLGAKAVYQYDEGLRQHVCRVTALRPFSDLPDAEKALFKAGVETTRVLETAETIFYAQGGGQPFDTGVISRQDSNGLQTVFEVQAVRNAPEGRVLHFGTFKSGEDAAFANGDMVEQRIDGGRRDSNSKYHTAGHCIGLSVRRLMEKAPELEVSELKAQHYPDASFVEFKGVIDGSYKDAIQQQVSEFVKAALPVKLYWFKPEELEENGVFMAPGMPIVAGPDGKVRVVDIVGAGGYCCGGTHTADTSLVGDVVIKGIKRQKGISKISYTLSGG